MFSKYPTSIMLELTNLCNLRCKMCGIWAEPNKKIFDLGLLSKLLQDKMLKNLKNIALTGGEPFLIKNLEDYYSICRKYFPKAYINISTNGYLTDRILAFLNDIDTGRFSITISYDGIYSHDSIRRIKGSAYKLLQTALEIKKIFPDIPLSLKMTITPDNYNEILDTARQCKELGIDFRFKTMEKINCHQNRYASDISDPNYTDEMMNSISEQSKEILKMDLETNKNYIKQLIKQYSGEKIGCNCSSSNLFIGIDGNVFLCRKKGPIGNLNRSSFQEIWLSEKKKSIVDEMKFCKGDMESLTYLYN